MIATGNKGQRIARLVARWRPAKKEVVVYLSVCQIQIAIVIIGLQILESDLASDQKKEILFFLYVTHGRYVVFLTIKYTTTCDAFARLRLLCHHYY